MVSVFSNDLNDTAFFSELLAFLTLSIVHYSKNIREHNVLEPGSVSIFRGGGTLFSPLEITGGDK
jgi:hypothetical protein